MSVRILIGDVREQLKTLPDESVHCCVTSPPYFGLRDYGVEGQIGLEDSPQEFVSALVDVFEEVRRVLRSDGTCWVNMGDSYAGSWGAQSRPQGPSGEMADRSVISARQIRAHPRFEGKTGTVGREWGLKPKDLMLVPFRLALALQEAGWWVRSDIIWAKPNPMPESVKDRPTSSHEHIFMLAKSEAYYFDGDAVKEPDVAGHKSGNGYARVDTKNVGYRLSYGGRGQEECWEPGNGRNIRNVWNVATRPYSGAHFATFPTALIEPCILAGCPKGGTVLDPFFGAGTTGLVCDRHGRDCIGIELNPEYAEIARKRITNDAPLFAEVA